MRIFEQQMDLIENFKTGIQKRNNILYLDPTRSSTVYLRVNGDCKYCPKHARVRYVFTIRNRPSGSEALIRVNVKLRGTHVHEGSGKAKGWRERLGEDGETGLDFHVGVPSSCALKEKVNFANVSRHWESIRCALFREVIFKNSEHVKAI